MRTTKQRPIVRYSPIEGADNGRLLEDWLTATFSMGGSQMPGLRIARNRSRDLTTNNDYVRGAIQSICNNVLGESGIAFQAKVPQQRGGKINQKINDQIETLWNEWAENPDWCHTGGRLTLLQLEHLILRTIIIDGEVLIRLVDQQLSDSPVPLSIDVIDPDCLADIHWAGQRQRVFMGIEVDGNYRPVNYWIYRNHPTDAFLDPWQDAPDPIPAGEILHLFVSDRTKQIRGKPWLVSSLKRMQHLGNYEEAEVVKARAQAAITGFIQSPQPEPFGPAGEDDEGNPNVGTVVEFEPGTIMQLQPGEEFQGFSPTAPESGLGDFLKHMLRGFAAGIGVGYAPVSRDYSEANYSSERSSKLEEHSAYRLIQKFLIDSFRVPLYHAWLDQANLVGALNLPNYELQRRQYQKAKFTGKTFDWVDPQKDIAACKDAIKGGLSTLTNELAKRGLDLEETVEQLKQEKELCKDLFLDVFLPDPAPPAPAGEPEPEVAKGLKKIERALEQFGDRLSHLENTRELQALRDQVRAHEEQQTRYFAALDAGLTPVHGWIGERKAKKCKAKPCGNSCISTKKTCLSDLSSEQKKLAQKAQKAMKAGKIGNAVDLPEPPKPEEKKLTGIGIGQKATVKNPFGKGGIKEAERLPDEVSQLYEFEVPMGDRGTITGKFLVKPEHGYLKEEVKSSNQESFDFLAKNWNGKTFEIIWNHDGQVSDRSEADNRRIARKALTEGWPKVKENLEQGSIVVNTPSGGAGAARDRAYQRQGFGKVHKSCNQYAFVDENRNLIPIEFDKIEYKNRAGKISFAGGIDADRCGQTEELLSRWALD